LAGATAFAHGPQIQITTDAGQIVTRELKLDGPYSDELSSPKSVYVIPVKEQLGAWYVRPNNEQIPGLGIPNFYSGPGYAFGFGVDPAVPDTISFAAGSVLTQTFVSGLEIWNGSSFADAGSTQIEAFLGTFTFPTATARTSDSMPFASLALPALAYGDGDEAHATVRYRLLGDGISPTSSSVDGIYRVSLQLSSNETGLMASDPFQFVLHKNAPRAAVEAAVASLGIDAALVQFVPEPTGAALMFVSAVYLIAYARRSSR
jgi:hypothetical protein